jgi:hypothetical protein
MAAHFRQGEMTAPIGIVEGQFRTVRYYFNEMPRRCRGERYLDVAQCDEVLDGLYIVATQVATQRRIGVQQVDDIAASCRLMPNGDTAGTSQRGGGDPLATESTPEDPFGNLQYRNRSDLIVARQVGMAQIGEAAFFGTARKA